MVPSFIRLKLLAFPANAEKPWELIVPEFTTLAPPCDRLTAIKSREVMEPLLMS